MAPSSSVHAKTHTPTRATVFGIAWVVSTLVLVALMFQGRTGFEETTTLYAMAAMLVCTGGLLWWLRNPIPVDEGTPTHRFRLALMIIAACAVLFPLRTIIGPPLLFGLPVIALIVLAVLRQPFSRQEIAYTTGLSLVAGLAGLGAGWIKNMAPLVWGGLQIPLTLLGLLAGWAILRRSGLDQFGVGRSRFLESGPMLALKTAVFGVLLSIPWALGLVLTGSAKSETWVQAWWQPLMAIQPGIAEEAWGRVLLVPLLFLLFRLAARPRVAFGAAVIVAGYWFAYLHTSGGAGAIFSTLFIGTLYALPISYLCLYRDLETAIGFHFWLDFVKFLWALLFI